MTEAPMTLLSYLSRLWHSLSNAWHSLKRTPRHIIGTIGFIIGDSQSNWFRNHGTDVTAKVFETAAKWELTLFCALLNKRRDNAQNIFLHYVARDSNPETARTLIRTGANVNATNHVGTTPLHLAIAYNAPEMVKDLIEAGADVNAKDIVGHPPLQLATTLVNTFVLSVFENKYVTAQEKKQKKEYTLKKIHYLIKAGATFTIEDAEAIICHTLQDLIRTILLRPNFSKFTPQQQQEAAPPVIKAIRPALGTSQETLAEYIKAFPALTELLQNAVYQNRKKQIRESQMQGHHLAKALLAALQSINNTPNHVGIFPEEIARCIAKEVSPIKAHQNAIVMSFMYSMYKLSPDNPKEPSETTPNTNPNTTPVLSSTRKKEPNAPKTYQGQSPKPTTPR